MNPMDTSPKDGTPIIVFGGGEYWDSPAIVRWCKNRWMGTLGDAGAYSEIMETDTQPVGWVPVPDPGMLSLTLDNCEGYTINPFQAYYIYDEDTGEKVAEGPVESVSLEEGGTITLRVDEKGFFKFVEDEDAE